MKVYQTSSKFENAICTTFIIVDYLFGIKQKFDDYINIYTTR